MAGGTHFRVVMNRGGGVAALALVAGILGTALPGRAQFPADAAPLCAVSSSTFNGWFQSGSPAPGGFVMPANSVSFSNPPNSNCAFYQWAEQMFLWVTSPIPPNLGYGPIVPGSGMTPNVFDSTVFFDVSPPDANGNRTLVPHPLTPVPFRFAEPRARKAGPNGLPILKGKRGQMLELETPRIGPAGKPLIADGTGTPVEIARVRVAKNGKATLFDARGKAIALRPKTVPARTVGHSIRVMALRTICNVGAACNTTGTGGVIQGFIDVATGSIIETESDQAQEGPNIFPVLLTQNNSLVYYSIMVNDVWANFLTGINSHAITPNPLQFPINQTDLNAITKFAMSQGQVLTDATALTIELKAAWVDASTLPASAIASGSYITTKAMVPTYNMTPTKWTPTGQTQKTLALVGLHVVGSVAGHPEMIFATFEHFGNAPNAGYSYLSSQQGPHGANLIIRVLPDSGGPWLLAAAGTTGTATCPPWNCPHMIEVNGTIQAYSPFTITPSNTLRMKPFGAASDTAPNPNVSTPAASNSEIISVNSSVRNLMTAAGAGADPRNNYYMIGAAWSQGGAAPPGLSTGLNPNFFGPPPIPANVIGTSQLFNTTMETYDQGPGTVLFQGQNTGETCFDCHGGSLAISSLSHIFSSIKATTIPR
jgi:hypothetical protein